MLAHILVSFLAACGLIFCGLGLWMELDPDIPRPTSKRVVHITCAGIVLSCLALIIELPKIF